MSLIRNIIFFKKDYNVSDIIFFKLYKFKNYKITTVNVIKKFLSTKVILKDNVHLWII